MFEDRLESSLLTLKMTQINIYYFHYNVKIDG